MKKMDKIEFINEKINELKSKLESLNKNKKTNDIPGVNLYACWEIKLAEDELTMYQLILMDLNELYALKHDPRLKILFKDQ